MGRHSSRKDNRESDLDQLGPGVILYFKMLKYLHWVFLLLTLISIPSLVIYQMGNGYSNSELEIASFFARNSLGSLNQYESVKCQNSES